MNSHFLGCIKWVIISPGLLEISFKISDRKHNQIPIFIESMKALHPVHHKLSFVLFLIYPFYLWFIKISHAILLNIEWILSHIEIIFHVSVTIYTIQSIRWVVDSKEWVEFDFGPVDNFIFWVFLPDADHAVSGEVVCPISEVQVQKEAISM